jgi:ATP-dependent helicase/nuclease subunit A
VAGVGQEDKLPEQCWYKQIKAAVEDMVPEDDHMILRFPQLSEEVFGEVSPPPPISQDLPAWVSQPLLSTNTLATKDTRPKNAEAVSRGILIHRLFEVLPELPSSQRKQAAMTITPGLSREDQEAVIGLIADPRYSDLFGPASLAEVPISGVINGQLIQGRIDRLVVQGDQIIILDYKSGAVPTSPDKIPQGYRDQLNTYAQLLADIFPGADMRLLLLWTEGPELMEIEVKPRGE